MGYSYSVCYCYECIKMDLTDMCKYDNNAFWCNEYRKYIDKNDHACSSYFVYNENMRRTSGCYITTMVCDIMGMDDNSIYLEKLRSLRDFMKLDKEYQKLLVEYDIVGPMICQSLEKDPFKKFKSYMALEMYIKPVYELLNQGKYSEAIEKYQLMTDEFRNFYNIEKPIFNIDEIDLSDIGKGHKIKYKK